MVFVASTESCHFSRKAARDSNIWAWLCSNKTLFIKISSGPDLADWPYTGPTLLIQAVRHAFCAYSLDSLMEMNSTYSVN